MRQTLVIHMNNAGQSTQTDFYKNIGMNVNLKILENNTKRNWGRVIGT